jgi:hypothetical protein
MSVLPTWPSVNYVHSRYGPTLQFTSPMILLLLFLNLIAARTIKRKTRTRERDLIKRLAHFLWFWLDGENVCVVAALPVSAWALNLLGTRLLACFVAVWRHFVMYIYCTIEICLWDRLCCLVVRVPGYRSRGPGSIPDATRFSEK